MSNRTLPLDGRLYDYLLRKSLREPAALAALRAETASHPHVNMQIAPEQGQFMQMLVRLMDARLAAGEAGHYDFAFIDADKGGYHAYYERLLRLILPGGLIAVDNTLWSGAVADPRIDLSLLPVGDGLTLARRRP